MLEIILKLILAHLIGDFFIQPKKWVKDKEKKRLKSRWLYIHVVLHVALMFLILWDLSYTLLIVYISITHLLIDALKLVLQRKKTKRLYFFLDQLLHVLAIVIFTWFYFGKPFDITMIVHEKALLFIVSAGFLTVPMSVVMKTVFLKWDIKKITENNASLEDAGTYIGILERLLVFIFIIVGHWEAVGFLITAKSVFRFGDLTSTKERKLTEYILIGTLISFGMAILMGLLFLNLQSYV